MPGKSVNFAQNFFGIRLGVRSMSRVFPSKGIERLIFRGAFSRGLLFQHAAKVNDEPGLAAGIAWRIDRLVVELKQTLGVGEGTFFFGLAGCGHKEDFGGDVLRIEFSAANFGGVVPEGGGLGFYHLAHDQPFELRQSRALQTTIGSADYGVLAHHKEAVHFAVLHLQPVAQF